MKSIMDCKSLVNELSRSNFEYDSTVINSTLIKEEQEEDVNNCSDFYKEVLDSDTDGSKNESEYVESEIEKMLIKTEYPSDAEENYELTSSDIEKEFDKFNTEDERLNSGKTILENNTTVYRCQICNEVFRVFSEYRSHKKQHFIEKRTCKICNIVCQGISKLEDHLNKHWGLKPFKCDVCDKSFISKHQVKLHKKTHNTEKRYKCTKCDKAFTNSGSLRSHQLVHAERVTEVKCKICDKKCKDLPEFRLHMMSHGETSQIKCGLCNKAFNSDRALESHINIHKELKFPCEFCGKIYPSMYRIKRHIKRAHIPNKCEECDEVFYDRALFTKHMRQHKELKPSECEYCHKIFDKAKNLAEHIRLQHREDGEKKPCPVCGKEFINNSLLRNHVKTHDKHFKCSNCERVFASRYNLELHSVTHSGIRNFKCHICEKSYRTKTALKNHVPLHSEERSFQCDQCPKTFKTNRRLYVHKMSHATEEKYQCEICCKRFRVKQYLNCHMFKHSNVKAFQCEICKKRFKHKKTYEKHMNVGKHKIKEVLEEEEDMNDHECEICGETFESGDSLMEHFSTEHSEENINNVGSSKTVQEGLVVKEEVIDNDIYYQ